MLEIVIINCRVNPRPRGLHPSPSLAVADRGQGPSDVEVEVCVDMCRMSCRVRASSISILKQACTTTRTATSLLALGEYEFAGSISRRICATTGYISLCVCCYSRKRWQIQIQPTREYSRQWETGHGTRQKYTKRTTPTPHTTTHHHTKEHPAHLTTIEGYATTGCVPPPPPRPGGWPKKPREGRYICIYIYVPRAGLFSLDATSVDIWPPAARFGAGPVPQLPLCAQFAFVWCECT